MEKTIRQGSVVMKQGYLVYNSNQGTIITFPLSCEITFKGIESEEDVYKLFNNYQSAEMKRIEQNKKDFLSKHNIR